MSRLKVFGVINHIGNQYEMLKLAKRGKIKFHYLLNNVRKWGEHYSARPRPETFLSEDQFEWVTAYEPGKYDLAILHVDQQHVNPEIGKGQIYRELNEVIQDIPKIVINHGTPMYPEMYPEEIVINGGEITTPTGKKHIDGMKQLIGDNFMIVNSYEAVNRWGWGYPIIHGMDKDEWWDLPKEPRVVIQLSPGGLDTYYNRQLLTSIKGRVSERSGIHVVHISLPKDWVARDWDDYRRFLGSSLIYINPTKDSPMPRSRTEAMLSGACVLSSKYHGADEFIEQGVNGFIVPDNPLSYAEAIHHLLNNNYREAVEIGQRGKETAQKLFNVERYLTDLEFVINEVANGRRPEWLGQKIWS